MVKLTVDASWTEAEDAVVRVLNPDYTRAQQRLPHRSREAIRHRAVSLGIKQAAKLWTQPEVVVLKRLWPKATNAEFTAALPRWPMSAIDRKARRLGLVPRGQPPLNITGNVLCDAIRDRCRTLGYSMAYLDRIANAGTYFAAGEWKNKAGHRNTPMIRAVNALGGTLNVEWPD